MDKALFAECFERRQKFLKEIGPKTIAIVGGSEKSSSDLYYLTGFPEPNAIAIFIPNRDDGEYILFSDECNQKKEMWFGKIVGQERAKKEYGAQDAFPLTQFDAVLPDLLLNKEKMYFAFGDDLEFDIQILDLLKKARNKASLNLTPPENLTHLSVITKKLRLIKSNYEIALIRKSAEIAVAAHLKAMNLCRPGIFEYEIEAKLHHEYMEADNSKASFKPIIAGGSNACTLHYEKNDSPLKEGSSVIIDSGVDYKHYASDISRTIPIGKDFSDEQKAIYQVVLNTEIAVIEKIRPGITWDELEETAKSLIKKQLSALGISDGERFYMHRIGHWLGLDVHDVGDYTVPFKPGMALAIEPGIYIQENSENIDKKWYGIGMRIEDDILVTENGCEVLTKDLPK